MKKIGCKKCKDCSGISPAEINDAGISEGTINGIIANKEKCEKLAGIFIEATESDEEPCRKRIRQMLRAYRNNDCDGMLIALCGRGLKYLIDKLDKPEEE